MTIMGSLTPQWQYSDVPVALLVGVVELSIQRDTDVLVRAPQPALVIGRDCMTECV